MTYADNHHADFSIFNALSANTAATMAVVREHTPLGCFCLTYHVVVKSEDDSEKVVGVFISWASLPFVPEDERVYAEMAIHEQYARDMSICQRQSAYRVEDDDDENAYPVELTNVVAREADEQNPEAKLALNKWREHFAVNGVPESAFVEQVIPPEAFVGLNDVAPFDPFAEGALTMMEAAAKKLAPSPEHVVSIRHSADATSTTVTGIYIGWHLLPNVPENERVYAEMGLHAVFTHAQVTRLQVTPASVYESFGKPMTEEGAQAIGQEASFLNDFAKSTLHKWMAYFQEHGIPDGAYVEKNITAHTRTKHFDSTEG